jgi:hypothetical protein
MLPREEHLLRVSPLLQAIALTLAKRSVGAPLPEATWTGAIHAECMQCGLRVSGADLLAAARVSALAAGDHGASDKVQRLCKGYCARKGCDSYYYKLWFTPIQGVDWMDLLAHAEGMISTESELSLETAVLTSSSSKLHLRWTAAIALAALVAAILFIAWQSYFGGSIPLLRSPERFEVDHNGTGE